MTATYWEVGRRIVEGEQGGEMRAEYGKALLERLSADLTKRFGRGFSRQNLQNFRQLFLTFSEICQTVSGKLADEKLPTASGELTRRDGTMIAALRPAMSRFQLP